MQDRSFHQRLKDETKPLHDQMELSVLPKKLFEKTISLDEYKRYLFKLYQIHFAVEKQLQDFNWKEFGIDIDKYMRLVHLEDDLSVLNLSLQPLKVQKGSLFDDFSHAVGYLYVLTGSTMGGKILAQKVEQLPHLLGANTYFKAFEEETHQRWIDFLQKLSHYADSKKKQEDVITGAKDCYRYVKEGLVDE